MALRPVCDLMRPRVLLFLTFGLYSLCDLSATLFLVLIVRFGVFRATFS